MNPEGTLEAIAEVGVALAGFAAVVAVFRRNQGEGWSPAAATGVRFMVELSLATVVLALIPSPLALAGLGPNTVWVTSSVILMLLGVALFLLNVRRMQSLSRQGWRNRQPTLRVVGFILAASVIGAQLLNLHFRGPALYVAGLLGTIVLVGLQFIGFVATARSTNS